MDRKTRGPKKRNSSMVSSSLQRRFEEKQEVEESSLKKWVFICSICVAIGAFVMFSSSKKETPSGPLVLAKHDENLVLFRHQDVNCSDDESPPKFPGCSPERCARYVTDSIVSEEEAASLLEIAKKGFAFGGSSGSASILDLHSGALSVNESFLNIYKLLERSGEKDLFTQIDFDIYKRVRQKIQHTITSLFNLDKNKLYLTHPTFFSRLTSSEPKTAHDEYWHIHVDKETYESFHYTSLVYLTTYKKDFDGGRFIFVDQRNTTVEPKLGRLSFFTSGSENPHYVEKVTKGTRYALTISFTCDSQHKKEDFNGM